MSVNDDPEHSVGDIEGMALARNGEVLCSFEGPGTRMMSAMKTLCENSFRLNYGEKRTFTKDDFFVHVYV